MSYRSSNRQSPGFGIIKIDSNQTLDSYKPEFINRGIFTSATSYGSSETFSSLNELQNAGYSLPSETSISGSSLITNNGDGTYTVSSNKITINHKSMFCLKPNVKFTTITNYPREFIIGDPENSHLELSGLISSSGASVSYPAGAEDCYGFSTSFWPTPIQHSYSPSYISTNGYVDRFNPSIDLDSNNLIIIWRLL